ncbi:MAG: hypothetical protein V4731_15720 [Pseudomonadota bacterium]
MNILKLLTHGNALAEIFLEGHNPHALRKLDTADVDELRQKMHSNETLQAYVIGRIVGAGRGVWAVTDRAVLLRRAPLQGVERIELKQLESFEAERGRYGHSVRLKAPGRLSSLFGVDRDLARSFHDALKVRGLPSEFEDKPARSAYWQDASPAGWAQDCLRDAQLRLHPNSIVG